MADFNSSLPVRSENNGDVVVKVVDGTLTSQTLAIDSSGKVTVKLDDSSGNGITSQINGTQRALDIGIDVAGVQIDPRQIRTLTATDVVTAQQGTSPWVTSDLADGPVSPGTAATKSVLVGAQYNTALPTLTAAQQASLQLTSKGELIVIQDIGGSPVSNSNPMPVVLSSAPIGSSVNDYATSAALAASSSVNHDYTITSGKTFYGKKIWASASGKLKIEVQISPDGTTFTSKWVGFNSTANPNISIDLDELVFLESGTGAKIRVIQTNEDKAAMDVYSTISGTEV